MPVMSSPTAEVETSSSTGSIQKVYPQSGSVEMEATHFHISPLAKFAPKTYDGDHWIKCVKLPERQIQKSMRKQDRGNSL